MPAKKKPLFIVIGVLLSILLVGGAVFAITSRIGGNRAAEPTPTPTKKRVVEPTNIISVDQRPVVFIKPEADGRNVTIEVVAVKKPATEVEYELEYQSGELLQGVQGALELASLPARTTQLMGSCSAGGKCSYHTDVKGGTLLLRFLGEENYALKQDWKYIENKAKETAISSKDAKFQMETPELAKQKYIIVYNSPGYPENPPGTVVSDIYALQTSAPLTGKATLILRAAEEGDLVIAGYDGSEWTEFTGTVDGKMVTADVEPMQLYVVVRK
jgi:hypothetical protein